MVPYDAVPHDTHTILVTSLLYKGVPLYTTQKVARHRKEETTIGYAHALEAQQLAKVLPNSYG